MCHRFFLYGIYIKRCIQSTKTIVCCSSIFLYVERICYAIFCYAIFCYVKVSKNFFSEIYLYITSFHQPSFFYKMRIVNHVATSNVFSFYKDNREIVICSFFLESVKSIENIMWELVYSKEGRLGC